MTTVCLVLFSLHIAWFFSCLDYNLFNCLILCWYAVSFLWLFASEMETHTHIKKKKRKASVLLTWRILLYYFNPNRCNYIQNFVLLQCIVLPRCSGHLTSCLEQLKGCGSHLQNLTVGNTILVAPCQKQNKSLHEGLRMLTALLIFSREICIGLVTKLRKSEKLVCQLKVRDF